MGAAGRAGGAVGGGARPSPANKVKTLETLGWFLFMAIELCSSSSRILRLPTIFVAIYVPCLFFSCCVVLFA